ncbi:hypothetical protein ACFBZI_07495 [Moraxella sp. ZJ142]|uniref:hypothetical protein n=1 Tax=Moraxella marmotae TaxID=3344520 RepID=UPI0035D4C653
MTVITLNPISPTAKLINEINTWRRDAKKYKQTALYDLLSDTVSHIKKHSKEDKDASQGFTRSNADAAFSNYIRKRANYCCERCGKRYEPNSQGLQCSHHFSRRYYNIRFDADNALALCYNCHVFWFQKDIPEAGRWLENKLGKERIDRLIELKNASDATKRYPQSELDRIAEKYKQMAENL